MERSRPRDVDGQFGWSSRESTKSWKEEGARGANWEKSVVSVLDKLKLEDGNRGKRAERDRCHDASSLDDAKSSRFGNSTFEALEKLGSLIYEHGADFRGKMAGDAVATLLECSRPVPPPRGVQRGPHQRSAVVFDAEVRRMAVKCLGKLFSRAGSAVPQNASLDVIRVLSGEVNGALQERGNSRAGKLLATLVRTLHLALCECRALDGTETTRLVPPLLQACIYGISERERERWTRGYDASQHMARKRKEEEASNGGRSAYVPPHLRRSADAGDNGFSGASSDSDMSDSESSDSLQSTKVRLSALLCIQALNRSAGKAMHKSWTEIFPSRDALSIGSRTKPHIVQPLLHDPAARNRAAAAATISSLLDGPPSKTFLMQAAPPKTSARGFVTVFALLGAIVEQLHFSLINAVKKEMNVSVRISIVHAMSVLVGASPYGRVPDTLLVDSVKATLEQFEKMSVGSPFEIDNLKLQCIRCLAHAFSSKHTPSLSELLNNDIKRDRYRVVELLITHSKSEESDSVRMEAMSALLGLAKNYPSILCSHYPAVVESIEESSLPALHGGGSGAGGLRSSSDFSGADRVFQHGLRLLSEILRESNGVSSEEEEPPHLRDEFHHQVDRVNAESEKLTASSPGARLWTRCLQGSIWISLAHQCPQVRSAGAAVLLGMSTPIFRVISQPEDGLLLWTQVLDKIFALASRDVSAPTRSSACKAIGTFCRLSCMEEFREFLEQATAICVELVSESSQPVNIAGCWTLANLADALSDAHDIDGAVREEIAKKIARGLLSVSSTNDKLRSNIVRGLGNVSSVISFDGGGEEKQIFLRRIIDKIVDGVRNGNAKTQRNACRAIGTVFMNNSIDVAGSDWAHGALQALLYQVRKSANFKTRIHSATTLALPTDEEMYVGMLDDIIVGIVISLEDIDSSSSFSEEATPLTELHYRPTLWIQLMSTLLHCMLLCSDISLLFQREEIQCRSEFLKALFKEALSARREQLEASAGHAVQLKGGIEDTTFIEDTFPDNPFGLLSEKKSESSPIARTDSALSPSASRQRINNAHLFRLSPLPFEVEKIDAGATLIHQLEVTM